jgi:hypothetical protein
MKKYSAIISAMVLAFFVLGTVSSFASGAGDVIMPKEITKEEAAKKYPLPAGKASYPQAISAPTSTGGFFQSPYSSRVYDCRKVKKGACIVDEGVNKVFLRP